MNGAKKGKREREGGGKREKKENKRLSGHRPLFDQRTRSVKTHIFASHTKQKRKKEEGEEREKKKKGEEEEREEMAHSPIVSKAILSIIPILLRCEREMWGGEKGKRGGGGEKGEKGAREILNSVCGIWG